MTKALEPRTFFINQCRLEKMDGTPFTGEGSKWENTCAGHHELYQAISCHDEIHALMDGEIDPEGMLELVAVAANQKQLERLEREGLREVYRIVKMTQTAEESISEEDAVRTTVRKLTSVSEVVQTEDQQPTEEPLRRPTVH